MPRLQKTLAACRNRNEKVMGLFLTCGFPDLESTLPILRTLDRNGADFFELGMPFSDPLAEGLPIQRSSERALRNGARLRDALDTAASFRAESETPLLLMGYVNPILHYGAWSFCRDAAAAGIDGLILVDLPPEEQQVIAGDAKSAGLGVVNLIAPNTADERVRTIDETTTAFVYAVSITGLTGTRLGAVESVEAYLKRVRGIVRNNPLYVGFGIRSHEDAARLSVHTDGFIVGTALIELIERLWDEDLSLEERLERIGDFAHELKYGDRVPAP